MRHATLVLILLLIPLLLFCSFNRENPFQRLNISRLLQEPNRSWRLNETLEEHYYLNQWMVYGKYDFYYNNFIQTRLDSIVYSNWGTAVPNDWSPFMTIAYTYDNTNEYVTGSLLTMNMGTMLYQMQRGTFTYDSQNRLTMELIEGNSSLTDPIWQTRFWVKINYATNTDFTVSFYQAAGSEDPQMWERNAFTWDAQGRIIDEVSQVSPDSTNWENSKHTYRTFDPNDTTTGDIFVHRVAHWLPFEFNDTDFWFNGTGTMMGMVSQETEQNWVSGYWANENLYSYTYNGFYRLTEVIEHSWNDGTSFWDYYHKTAHSYYDNQNLRYQTISEWNTFNLEWDPQIRYTCTWGQATAGQDEILPSVKDMVINVSPNPFRNQTRISIRSAAAGPATVQIYNLVGQLVKSFSLSKNATYTWDGKDKNGTPVSAGIYFLKADHGVHTHTVKLLRVK